MDPYGNPNGSKIIPIQKESKIFWKIPPKFGPEMFQEHQFITSHLKNLRL
jgi:hypothetical protein